MTPRATTGAYDCVVVGAGIVGLATALQILRRRPGCAVAVLERAHEVATEQTGHCSNVVHAGIYYAPGSLKARFCKEGNAWTKQFCLDRGLPFEQCGKMIVATTPLEVERLHDLYARALENELDVELIAQAELHRREPNVEGLEAIFLSTTGITSYKAVAEEMAKEIEALGGRVVLDCDVVGIDEDLDGVRVRAWSGGGGARRPVAFRTDRLAVCAGIQGDRLARAARLDVDWSMVPFRGEYYRLPDSMGDIAHALIYPVPDPDMPFLGVHLTRMVDGSQTVGPSAVLGFSRTGYPKLSVSPRDVLDMVRFPGFWKLARGLVGVGLSEQWDSLVKRSYLKRVQKYCRQISVSDLGPYPCGIRAQAVSADGTMIEDFTLRETPRSVHVVNAPSPAATSAWPIGGHIADRILSDDLGTAADR